MVDKYSTYKNIKIKTKLIALVFLILIGSFGLQGYIYTQQVRRDMEAIVSAQQFAVASYMADDIESKIRLRIDFLTAAANNVTPSLLNNPDKARSYLQSNNILQTLFKGGVILISADGMGIADYPIISGRQGHQFNDLEYFIETMNTGQTSIGKPRVGNFSKKPVVAITAPIKNNSGDVIGMLVGISSLSDPMLFGQIENAAFGKSGYIAIDVPKYGIIATSSDKSRILDKMAKPGVNKMLDKFVAGYEGSGIAVNSKGIETLTSAKRIPSTGWIVQIVLPTKEAFIPAQTMQWRAYQISGGLSVLAILLAWFFLRRVLRPLHVATTEIHQMISGKGTLHALPVSGQDEVGIFLSSFNRLVEQRNEVEQALAESEETLSSIIETEPECVKILALDGTLLRMNRAGLNMIQADTEEQVIGMKVVQLLLPEHQDAFNALNAKTSQGGSGSLEFEIIGLKGAHCWLDTHSVPMHNARGDITGLLSVTRDITEKKRLELQLKRYEAIVQFSEDAIISKRLDGVVISWNPGAESIFGYTAEEMIGKTNAILLPENYQHEETEILQKIKNGGIVKSLETIRLRKDGTLINISVTISPILDNHGNVVGISEIARDITEKKRAEHELERLAQTDMLTGLANRRHFMTLAEQELARAVRYGGKLSVLMIDIDHFKNVNDTYGHHAGDLVIQKLGELCQQTLRKDIDVAGRIGGEEFAVILPETDSQQAVDAAERLRDAIARTEVPWEQGGPLHFTVSVGVASLAVQKTNLDTLLAYADQSLYEAKAGGRNRVCEHATLS
ncbi:MAG: diguanylate cyclase [Burkholderiaceae bacterium]|nr:diguanylate cyclase [Burkholderiaceae bacterium]